MKNSTNHYLPVFIAAGMFLGICLGVLGSWKTGDAGLWIPLGVGGGIALGALSFLLIPGKK